MSLSKYEGFVRASDYFDKRIASSKLDGYKIVEPGAWAFSTIHIDEGSIARNNSAEPGVISPMYTTMHFVSEVCLPEYAELLVKQPRMLAEYGARAQGTVNRRRSLPFSRFSGIPVALPSLEEQRRIVDVMAAVDAQIEALGDETARLDRTAWVTAERLLSGHATVALGDHLVEISGGRSPMTTGEVPSVDQRGVLKVSAVTPFRFVAAESKALFPETQMPEAARVRPGDVLITRANTPDRVGAVCRVPETVRPGLYLCDKTLRMTPAAGLDPDFLVVAMGLNASRYHLTGAATGTSASMFNIGQEKIRQTPIPLPDSGEQRDIASTVLSIRAKGEAGLGELAHLRTFRSALLSSLLNQDIEIPESYDSLLEEAS